jgi:SulP family sulfate permease
MRGYNATALCGDLLAGLTVALIAFPLALALGIASIPAGTETRFSAPFLGLIAAVMGGFLVALLGGSRVQIGGPTAAFVPVILVVVSQYGYTGLLVATMMAGVMLVLMGLLRMGTWIKFIPSPVVSGFTTGIAVSIVLSQAVDFLGIQAATHPPREFIERLRWLIENASGIQFPALILSVVCLGFILLW